LANGEGFLPECGESIALVSVPDVNTVQVIIAQVTIAMLEMPCGSPETAWAASCDGREPLSRAPAGLRITHTRR